MILSQIHDILRSALGYVPDCLLATGSRVYGTPHDSSDWDYVVLLSLDDQYKLSPEKFVNLGYAGCKGIDCSIRVGNANFLCVSTHFQFAAWCQGTQMLIEAAPVTREQAVMVFTTIREARGLK